MTGHQREDADTERKAKGSVKEAIGKLIGDDAVEEHGVAEQRAADKSAGKKP